MYDPKAHGSFCDICPLKGKTVVPPAAHPSPQFVVVGEGPGRVEERLGAPFMGASGKLLDQLLHTNGLRRDKAHITNAALCRGESDRENDKAAECCAPRLLRELEAAGKDHSSRDGGTLVPRSRTGANGTAPPTLLLGKAATRSVLGVASILAARGFIFSGKEIPEEKLKTARQAAEVEAGGSTRARSVRGKQVRNVSSRGGKNGGDADTRSGRKALAARVWEGRAALAGRTFCPSIHPAFVLRADTWAPIIRLDFARFARVVKGEIGKLSDDAAYSLQIKDLNTLGPTVSLDIETDGVRVLETKILSVQISDGGNTVVLWPWKSKYAKPLSRFLRSRQSVVAHNGFQFDQIVCERHGIK
jgi:uracil-DNA glycosylase